MKGTTMKIFDKQLLVSDFDGTLLNSKKLITNKNLKAIRYFTDNGGLFCGATGRTPSNIKGYMKGLPLNCSWILFNGACIYDFRSNSINNVTFLKHEPLISILSNILELFPTLNIQIHTVNHLFLSNPNGIEDKLIKAENQEVCLKSMESIDMPWVKVILHEESNMLKRVFKLINVMDKLNEYNIFFSIDTYMEITHRSASKGSALSLLKSYLGDRVSKVIAIGDYFNDLEMLEIADVKAAPKNAHPKIKAMADYITQDCDNSAVADLIKYLAL